MKKLNKKGFTLIELLAVIIILGVLMIIAIPSVTEYISSSRKSAMVDTADGYIKAVMTKVNEAKDLKFFDTNTLYLVPVGHEDGKSCSPLEKGGASPFHDEWKYAYVGVTYNGSGYTYYFMAKDGSNQGIKMIEQSALAKKGGDVVVSGMGNLLDTYYSAEANASYITSNCTDAAVCTGTAVDDAVITSETLTETASKLGVTRVVVVSAKGCAYSG
ncbi:MAG: prepilin-type N-terminal cleavage/methylation domain-containing protein [Bacilli bacterium]|nr:prepilin-type N-terminal cleavage/methylation domain-containing protein [Bacilli bacterium]